jgi:hypothetical protein
MLKAHYEQAHLHAAYFIFSQLAEIHNVESETEHLECRTR